MKYDSNHALLECSIPGVPSKSGKVRDVFDLGDKLLMVVTDRISAPRGLMATVSSSLLIRISSGMTGLLSVFF